jgi:hypothetical protein
LALLALPVLVLSLGVIAVVITVTTTSAELPLFGYWSYLPSCLERIDCADYPCLFII